MKQLFILLLCLFLSSLCLSQTKVREGVQTMGALPKTQGGVPTGGNTNQTLKKLSNTDYDTGWTNAGGTIEQTNTFLQGDGLGNAIGSNVTESDAFFDVRTTCTTCDGEMAFVAGYPSDTNSLRYSLSIGSYTSDFKLLSGGDTSIDVPTTFALNAGTTITLNAGSKHAKVTTGGVLDVSTGFSIGGTPLPFAGGTTGQVLTKASNNDYDWTWSAAAATPTATATFTPTPTATATATFTPTATATSTATPTPTPTATPTATAVTLTIDGVAQQIDTNRTWNEDHSVTFVVDGAGIVLGIGTKNPVKVPFGGTLQGWTTTCKPSCSITIDILRAADGAGLPVTSIVGGTGTKPFITTAVENSSTDFTNWTSTTLTAKDNLAISLSGITAATYVELTLYYK